jgi:hypothetical protein
MREEDILATYNFSVNVELQTHNVPKKKRKQKIF